MIAKANTFLLKAESVREAVTAQLEQMIARSIDVQQLEAKKRSTLEEVQSCLA